MNHRGPLLIIGCGEEGPRQLGTKHKVSLEVKSCLGRWGYI